MSAPPSLASEAAAQLADALPGLLRGEALSPTALRLALLDDGGAAPLDVCVDERGAREEGAGAGFDSLHALLLARSARYAESFFERVAAKLAAPRRDEDERGDADGDDDDVGVVDGLLVAEAVFDGVVVWDGEGGYSENPVKVWTGLLLKTNDWTAHPSALYSVMVVPLSHKQLIVFRVGQLLNITMVATLYIAPRSSDHEHREDGMAGWHQNPLPLMGVTLFSQSNR